MSDIREIGIALSQEARASEEILQEIAELGQKFLGDKEEVERRTRKGGHALVVQGASFSTKNYLSPRPGVLFSIEDSMSVIYQGDEDFAGQSFTTDTYFVYSDGVERSTLRETMATGEDDYFPKIWTVRLNRTELEEFEAALKSTTRFVRSKPKPQSFKVKLS